jgi:hypothetical protein
LPETGPCRSRQLWLPAGVYITDSAEAEPGQRWSGVSDGKAEAPATGTAKTDGADETETPVDVRRNPLN